MGASGSNVTFTVPSQSFYFLGMRGSGYLLRHGRKGALKGGMMRKFNRIVATVLAMLMLALTVVIAPVVVRAEGVPDDVYTVPGDVYGVPGSKTLVIIMICLLYTSDAADDLP